MSLLLAVLAVALFALFDYIGYNTLGRQDLPFYRKVEFAVGVGFVLVLGLESLWAALMAAVLWWFFWCDLVYYAWAHLLKLWPAEVDSFQHEVQGNLVYWAWWTPVGLLMGRAKDRSKPISGLILLIQAGIGAVVVICIQLFAIG